MISCTANFVKKEGYQELAKVQKNLGKDGRERGKQEEKINSYVGKKGKKRKERRNKRRKHKEKQRESLLEGAREKKCREKNYTVKRGT